MRIHAPRISGSLAVSSSVLTIDTLGSVSGSATSTGSFGRLHITNTNLDDALLITSTEDSSTASPVITLKRNSGSPADSDYIGQVKFKGENDNDQEVVYAKVTGKIQDASDGSEDGLIEFANKKAGSNVITARLRSDSFQLLNSTNFSVAGTSTMTGNVTLEGNVTSSAASTGSFGRTEIGGELSVDAMSIPVLSTMSSSVATRFDSRETDMALATASIAAITASVSTLKSNVGQELNTDSNVTFGTITSGDINSTGTITATEIHTTFVSSSIAVASGSNIFGDDTADSHQFTGSLNVSGSLFVKDGTLTVTDNVDFNGGLDVDGDITLVSANNKISDGTNNILERTAGGYITIGDSAWNEIRLNTTGTTDFVLDNSGNVGIGTASPGHLLTVAGATDGDNPSIHIIAHGSDSGSIFFGESATNKNGGIEYDNGGQDMYFITNSSRKMKLETEGNLGIGNTVASTINSANNGGRLVVGDGSGNEGMTIYSGNGSDEYGIIYFADGTSGASTYQGWLAYFHDVNALTLATSGTEKMRITTDGNVEIKTTTAAGSNSQSLPGYLQFSGFGWDTNSGSDPIGARITMGGSYSGVISGGVVPHLAFSIQNSGDAGSTSETMDEHMRIRGDGQIIFNKTSTNGAVAGGRISAIGNEFTVASDVVFYINRQSNDGTLISLRQGDAEEGTISVSSSTVSYNGFSGNHESSGIPTNTAIGTVVSTIDELDVYPDTDYKTGEAHSKAGETRADHAKIKVSDSVGDKRVYGVLSSFNEDNKPIIASVGIGSVKVTGACEGGDLLESNGDGTAKVQDDDIIRSKTIGKVTIGDSDTGVKLVSCVLYCG
jgi:hypothetical protein